MIKASEIKLGDEINVPHVGWRVVTFIRKSRRYAGCMLVQWSETTHVAGQWEPKRSEPVEVK